MRVTRHATLPLLHSHQSQYLLGWSPAQRTIIRRALQRGKYDLLLSIYTLVPGRVHFFRVSGISGFAKSGFGLFRASTRSVFFVFYRVSGSSGSLKIRAVLGTRDVQIRCLNFQNHTKAIFQHFRGTKSKVMKRTCKIMMKSVFKMIRMFQKCQKSLA